jgi:hypothetical protein
MTFATDMKEIPTMRSSARLFPALATVLALALQCAPPAAAATSGGIGYIDSPDHGATYNRPPGAPGVNIDYAASGMKVWISGAAANQQYFVSTLFVLAKDGIALPAGTAGHGLQWITCDANGHWEELAAGTGVLQQPAYGTGPGNHSCTITSSLQVSSDNSLNTTYDHTHNFTVN